MTSRAESVLVSSALIIMSIVHTTPPVREECAHLGRVSPAPLITHDATGYPSHFTSFAVEKAMGAVRPSALTLPSGHRMTDTPESRYRLMFFIQV